MTYFGNKFHSDYFLELEEAWERGELRDIADAAVVFFIEKVDEFKDFICELKSKDIHLDLEMYAKLFVFRFNMPFNMEQYMERQSQYIRSKIKESCTNSSEEDRCERQAMVSSWIKEYAADHRHKEILRQIFCIRKIKHKFLPELQGLLNDCQCTLDLTNNAGISVDAHHKKKDN